MDDERYDGSYVREAAAPAAREPGFGPYYGDPGGQGRRRGMRGWVKGLLIVVAIFVALALAGIFLSPAPKNGYSVPDLPYIAKISVAGTISSAPTVDLLGGVSGYYHDWTLDRIDGLMDDPNNRGLILFIDTPGGGVYESDELYLKIKEYKEATGNPVYAAMGSMAASGGYYVSAPADRIYANRNTWTGSIGVTMGTMFDLSGFLSEHGIGTETITSGRNKAMGGYFEPMTDEQRGIFQGLVDEAYEQFAGIVADERGMDMDYVRSIADGRLYTAAQARELGLVDAIGSFDDALGDMKSSYGLEGCELAEIRYVDGSLFGRLLGEGLAERLGALARRGGDIGAVLDMARESGAMPLRYMYGG
ncbi:MAG: signal peptide peptidase SppA [Clostridiales Family XIII bacterium]|jgi:protease-4|nr:signal peptide peptidase SppA [Clostridiales Family XIII bacterium]